MTVKIVVLHNRVVILKKINEYIESFVQLKRDGVESDLMTLINLCELLSLKFSVDFYLISQFDNDKQLCYKILICSNNNGIIFNVDNFLLLAGVKEHFPELSLVGVGEIVDSSIFDNKIEKIGSLASRVRIVSD